LCTGNGSLAILAATVVVDALDISADALAVARINVDKHDLATCITLIDLMVWRLVHEKNAVYDLILCNPPASTRVRWMAALMAEFLAEIAWLLAGGPDGMDFIRGLF
jgi:ribosomal protein L3 glutamine methyltransferase